MTLAELYNNTAGFEGFDEFGIGVYTNYQDIALGIEPNERFEELMYVDELTENSGDVSITYHLYVVLLEDVSDELWIKVFNDGSFGYSWS